MVQWWRGGSPAYNTVMYSFVKKMHFIKFQLKRWNMLCYGNLNYMKKNVQEHINVITHQIQDHGFSEDLGKAESQVVRELEEWELREEIFWKQKAQIDWL